MARLEARSAERVSLRKLRKYVLVKDNISIKRGHTRVQGLLVLVCYPLKLSPIPFTTLVFHRYLQCLLI